MSMSIFTESEAPRDFRVSSTESDGHYKKCLLCYTVKRNFYCPECIRAGNFIHSSMPYSDRFAEKQVKLLRLKANRKHILERCEKLLSPKIKKDSLLTEAKQSRDKIDLLRLAIEQRKNSIEERKKELANLVSYNNELKLKLPRYQKRVPSLGKYVQQQRMELQNRISTYNDQAQALAALRRSRIRQLTKYIFPVYMTYDSSDSIEDLEFLGDDMEQEPTKRAQLHIVAPWIDADADFSDVHAWVAQNAESASSVSGPHNPLHRSVSALGLCAQLVALLAYTLDVRLPYSPALSELCNCRPSVSGLTWRVPVVGRCVGAVCARSGLPPPAAPRCPLAGIEAIATAAIADAPPLGRVEAWLSPPLVEAWCNYEASWSDVGAERPAEPEDEPPEHLHWPEHQQCSEVSVTPPTPQPAPSLVTSAAASLVSMWRGWTK